MKWHTTITKVIGQTSMGKQCKPQVSCSGSSQLAFSSGEEMKNRISRWRPSLISNPNDFTFFIYKLPRYFLPSLVSICLSVQVKERKIDFQDSDRNDFSYFLSTSHPDASYQFRVNWSFGSGEEAKNRLSTWTPWRPSWIFDWNDFTFLLIYKSPRCFLPSFMSTGLSVQEKKRKIDFQDGHHGGHLGYPIGTIFAISVLQVTQILTTKFRVNGLFGSGEEAKN